MPKNTMFNRSQMSVRTNTDQSLRQLRFYDEVNDKWFNAQANDMIRSKYRKIASDQKTQILNTFGKQFPEIMSFITLE